MQRGLLNPHSRFMAWWDMVILFAMVFTCFVTPFDLTGALFLGPALVVAAFVCGVAAVLRGQTLAGVVLLLLVLTVGIGSCAGGCLIAA